MPKVLSYAEAVRILGKGPGAEWVGRLNDLTGGLLLGATATTTAVLQWFDAYALFARLSQQLAGSVGQRLTGAHRLDRTERVAAAHTVIVVAAWFETLDDVGLPFELAAAEFTATEQLRLAGVPVVGVEPVRSRDLAGIALRAGVHLPEPHGLRPDHHARLRATYQQLTTSASRFLSGLSIWESLSPGERIRTESRLAEMPDLALHRYDRMLLDQTQRFVCKHWHLKAVL